MATDRSEINFFQKLLIIVCLIGALECFEALALIFSIPLPAPGFYLPYFSPIVLTILFFIAYKTQQGHISVNWAVVTALFLLPLSILLLETINAVRLGTDVKLDIFFQYLWLPVFIVVLDFFATTARARHFIVKSFFYLVSLKALLYLLANEITLKPTGAYLFGGLPLFDLKPWMLNGKLQYEAVTALILFLCFARLGTGYFRSKSIWCLDLIAIFVLFMTLYVVNSLFSYLLLFVTVVIFVIIGRMRNKVKLILVLFVCFLSYSLLSNQQNENELSDSVAAVSKATSDIYYNHERYRTDADIEGENQFGSVYSRLLSNWKSLINFTENPIIGKGYESTYQDSKYLGMNSHTHYLIILESYGLFILIPYFFLLGKLLAHNRKKRFYRNYNKQRWLILGLLFAMLLVIPDLLIWFSVIFVIAFSKLVFRHNPLVFKLPQHSFTLKKIMSVIQKNRHIMLYSVLTVIAVVGLITIMIRPEYGAIVSLKPISVGKNTDQLQQQWLYEMRRSVREKGKNSFDILSTSNGRILLKVSASNVESLVEKVNLLIAATHEKISSKQQSQTDSSTWISRVIINFNNVSQPIIKLRPNTSRNIILSVILGIIIGVCFIVLKVCCRISLQVLN